MIQMNVLEQLEIFLQLLLKKWYIIPIFCLVILILEIICSLKNKKINKVMTILVYILILGTLFYFYYNEILQFLDYLMNNLILFLFFPNLAVYTLIVIVINIVLVKAFISKEKKVEKHISILFFSLFNIIFYLIIDIVKKNNINVYEQLSIYTNNHLLVLIQLSMSLFMVWFGILAILKITKVLSNFLSRKEIYVSEAKLESIETEKPIINTENEFFQIPYFSENHSNIYVDYMDIEPVKKKKHTLSNMEQIFEENNTDMEVVFGKSNCLQNILLDIESLKENINDQAKLKKINDEIAYNSKDLTLEDYNFLVHALRKIKNSN